MNKNQHHTEDKLMAVYYKAVDFFEKNKKHVYITLSAIVIIAAGIILLMNKRKADDEKAAIELSKIYQVYSTGNFQQAINGDSLGNSKGLQFIVDEYGSSESGETAKIMLANSYYNIRDFDKAEKYFRDYSGKNKILKVSAEAGIGSVYEARNNFDEAAKMYEKAAGADKDNPFIDEYIFYAAKNYYRADKKDEAKKLFDKLKENYPKSKYIQESEKYRLTYN